MDMVYVDNSRLQKIPLGEDRRSFFDVFSREIDYCPITKCVIEKTWLGCILKETGLFYLLRPRQESALYVA